MTEHTPTPYYIVHEFDYEPTYIVAKHGTDIATIEPSDQALATGRFLVRAANSHDALVEALQRIEPFLTDCRCGQPDICLKCRALRLRREALDKAEAKP